MIRGLRRRHGVLILSVTAVVPLLAIVALFARPSPPVMPSASPAPSTEDWTAVGEDGQAHALIESDGSREWLHLVRHENLIAPDVLVYWASTTPRDLAPMRDDAVLLGALGDVGAHSFNLPLRDSPGVLLLYSLGHQTVVASTPVDSIARLDRAR